jgi:dihydrofolate reductase
MMKAILAADEGWGIGNRGKLLVSIPADMRFFQRMTTGNIVVMGRKTLESFPGGRPLKNRTNIVLTGNPDYRAEGARIVHGPDELADVLSRENKEGKDIFVIGGAVIYRLLLPYCDTVFVTKINYRYEADAYFPDLSRDPEWELAEESEEQTYFELTYTFQTWKRVSGGEELPGAVPAKEGESRCARGE